MNTLISCKLAISFLTVKLKLGEKPSQVIHRFLGLLGFKDLDQLRLRYRSGAFGCTKLLRRIRYERSRKLRSKQIKNEKFKVSLKILS